MALLLYYSVKLFVIVNMVLDSLMQFILCINCLLSLLIILDSSAVNVELLIYELDRRFAKLGGKFRRGRGYRIKWRK